MGYVVCKFQNASGPDAKPTIVIDETHPEWEEILERWKDGKNPTDSKEWKKGVFACTKIKN